jgi:hypothetical protein
MSAAYPVALAAKTDLSKPWVGLPIQIPRIAQVLFDIAIKSLVGNGEGTKFGLTGGFKENLSRNWLLT